MSLLLDALKKSEAQRRRGTSPSIDLTRTPPSVGSRRLGWRSVLGVVTVIAVIAAAPWLWPIVSDRIALLQDASGERSVATGVGDKIVSDTELESESEIPGPGAGAEVAVAQVTPAPVAGAASQRRVAVAEMAPQVAAEPGADQGSETGRSGASDSGDASAGGGVDPEPATAKPANAGSAQPAEARPSAQEAPKPEPRRKVEDSKPSEPRAQPARQANEPARNFIRPWEMPQAQREDFPDLDLTVHFYAEKPADRFVLINGERFTEGQRIASGVRLVEIRPSGAVVEFASYRLLIE